MLAMEAGGADVIELGIPFTDPLADGKAIQEANNVSSTSLVRGGLNWHIGIGGGGTAELGS